MKKFLWVVVFLCATLSFSQQKYSVLTGTVTANGNALPGVTLQLAGPNLMGQRSVVTNEGGVYRFSLVPAGGNYELHAKMMGFQPFVRKNISLPLGGTITLNVELNEATIEEEIIVTAEAPLIDTTSNQVSTNLRTEFVETLTNDRQFQMVMAMMPGSIEGNNPSMLGGADSDNVYMVDGADTTDPLTKTWGAAFNFDTLEEVQVIAGGVSAEYGRGQGAVVNLVTKSGGNEFHGNFRYITSDVDWNNKQNGKPFDEATKYTSEDRWAMTLGGPIIKDKLWFFVSYENRDKQKQTSHWNNLADFRTQDPARQVIEYPSYEGHYLSTKLTWQINDNHSLMVLYNEDPIEFPLYSYLNYNYIANRNLVKREQGGENLFFEWNWMLSSDSFLTVKFQDNDSPLSNLPYGEVGNNTTYPMQYYVARRDTGGYGGFYPQASAPHSSYDSFRKFNSYKAMFSKFLDTGWGSHDLSIGLEIRDSEYGDVTRAYGGALAMMYWYEPYEAYGYGGFFWDAVDERLPDQTNEDYKAIYIQDKWNVTDRLTLNLGLRTENLVLSNVDNVDIVENKFGDMMAPRIGFAYDIDGSSLHASYSRYYDAIGNWVVSNSQPGQQYSEDEYWLLTTPTALAAMGLEPWANLADWAQIMPSAAPELWAYNGNYTYGPDGNINIIGEIEPSYMDEFNIGYEWQVSPLYALGFNYFNRTWKDAYEDSDFDQDGMWEFQTVDGNWREYEALIFTAQKKLADDGFQFLFSYTYSSTHGYAAADNSTVYLDTAYDVHNWYGRVNDVPHVFKFNGSYSFDFGLLVGLNYILSDGFAYTGQISVTNEIPGEQNGDLQYVYAEKRGSRRAPTWSRADLHVEYGFNLWKNVELSIYVDIFNLFNTRSTFSVDTYMGSGYYDTDAVPGTQEYFDYVTTNSPVLEEANENFGDPDLWQFPRSFYLGFNIQF